MSEQSEQAKELVKVWNDELRAGKEYKKKYATPDKWADYKNYYRGNWAATKFKGEIPVNKTFAFARTMIPRTYFRSPGVSVLPTHPKYIWHARVVESIDNYLIKELVLKKTLKRSILDAFYAGVGPIKLGYDSQYGYVPDQAVGGSASTVTQTSDRQSGAKIEYRTTIKPGMPWAVAVQPEDIITPWGFRDAEDLPWVAHEYLRSLKDVRSDSKYQKDARGRVKGGFTRDADDPSRFINITDYKPDHYCLLKEIRDAKHRKLLVLCEDQLLMEVDDVLQIEGLPYEFTIFNDDPDHFWGISDIKMGEAQQLELNQIRTQAMKHRRISVLKFLYRKGVIEEDHLSKLLSEDIGAIEVKDGDIGLDQVVKELQSHIPPDLWREAQEVLGDYRETVGFSRNEAGEFRTGTPPSAHEVVAVGQGSEIRTDERRDVVADVLVNVIRKWNQFIFKHWTQEKVARVVGPDGAQYWLKYTGEELAGEYYLSVDPDSGQPITRAMRMQLAEKMFLALRMDPFTDPIKLREMYIRSQSWLDPGISVIMPNPQALQMIQQGATLGAQPGTGTGPDGRQSKTFGSPTRPLTINDAMRGGA